MTQVEKESPKKGVAPVEKLAQHAPKGLKASSGKFVKHNPMELFSARVISRADWESGGIYDQGGVEWSEHNDFRLPVEMFNEKALAYLRKDDGFEIVNG